MKILINYADKQYEPARKWNTLTGGACGRWFESSHPDW